MRMVAAVAVACLVAGCATFEESGLPGSAASMAHNQLMHVSRERQSFGYYRVTTLSAFYPDLDYFVRKQGMPDFLAETSNDGRNYYILYYVGRRHAFASRPRPGTRKALEFAGPYPITPREVSILETIRKRYPDSQGTRWGGVTREGAPPDESATDGR